MKCEFVSKDTIVFEGITVAMYPLVCVHETACKLMDILKEWKRVFLYSISGFVNSLIYRINVKIHLII